MKRLALLIPALALVAATATPAQAAPLPKVTHLHAVYANNNFGAEWVNSPIVTHVEVFFDYQLVAVYGEIESYGQADGNYAAGSRHTICARPEDGIQAGKMRCTRVTVP